MSQRGREKKTTTRRRIEGEAFALTVPPLELMFPVPKRHKACADVLEWKGDLAIDLEPAGRVRLFEIDHPRLSDRGGMLGDVLDRCLEGAYKEVLDASARKVWNGKSPLLIFESFRLFPNARGHGHSLAVVNAIVERFKTRGVGAVLMKAMPLQYVDGASGNWATEMGATIGGSPWFMPSALERNVVAYSKVANHWRRLGWREIRNVDSARPEDKADQPTFLLEISE